MAPRSEKELESLILEIQGNFDKAWEAKDAKAVADFYHPDAVLVSRGKWAVYGKKDIEAKFVEFLNFPFDAKPKFDSSLETENGEYIVHKGRFEMSNNPGVFCPYLQIYQKQTDGSYLIYHDEIEGI
uniref:SnoaL-like domain-containing protein n=1 Tax=Panagrolaimus sp. JU765 TaxID=591449 RepID=A0AC34QCQ6_9BILA